MITLEVEKTFFGIYCHTTVVSYMFMGAGCNIE